MGWTSPTRAGIAADLIEVSFGPVNMPDTTPHIVIVGGGFGGLSTAKALKNAPARVTLIDRTNHHLFQPLLYQVATSELTPGQIGPPLENIAKKEPHAAV